MGEFVAFQALISLLKDEGKEVLIQETYQEALQLIKEGKEKTKNVVKALYDRYDYKKVSLRISELLTPAHLTCEVKIIYQSLEHLQEACPNNNGDWFFSGNYPTPGGFGVVNRAFINFVENKNERAY